MTSDTVSAGGDARRLLAEARGLARRVRVAQRVTWVPLLALALVTFGAIPAFRYGHQVVTDCRTPGLDQSCKIWWQGASIYWWVALVSAYVVTAAVYLRVARARGLGARVRPYVIAGVALVAVSAAATAVLVVIDSPWYPGEPSFFIRYLLRLIDPTGVIGLALLVLAWLERHVALGVFAVAYLVVVMVPLNFGWGQQFGALWVFGPQLVINGTVLLLGSAGFAVAQKITQKITQKKTQNR